MVSAFGASLFQCLMVPIAAQTPDLASVPDVIVKPCTERPALALLEDKDVQNLIENFDFRPFEVMMSCKTFQTDWLRTGVILSLHGLSVGETDSNKDLTLIQLENEPRLWVIPISYGMIEVRNLVEDPHNLAAFNALIEENHVSPRTPEMWTSLALFYMNIVGNEIHTSVRTAYGESVPGLLLQAPFLKSARLLPSVACKKDECEVTINDTRFAKTTQSYTAWTLTFSTADDKVRLQYVDREDKKLHEKH